MSRWAARHYTTRTRMSTTRVSTTTQSCRAVLALRADPLAQTRHGTLLSVSCRHGGTVGTTCRVQHGTGTRSGEMRRPSRRRMLDEHNRSQMGEMRDQRRGRGTGAGGDGEVGGRRRAGRRWRRHAARRSGHGLTAHGWRRRGRRRPAGGGNEARVRSSPTPARGLYTGGTRANSGPATASRPTAWAARWAAGMG
jgi:hypothetical protein